MSGRETDNVLFLGNTKTFEEKKLYSVFTFTKAYLYATVGQILFFKPYRTIFDPCVHLLLTIREEHPPAIPRKGWDGARSYQQDSSG